MAKARFVAYFFKDDAAGDPLIKVGLELCYDFMEEVRGELTEHQGKLEKKT